MKTATIRRVPISLLAGLLLAGLWAAYPVPGSAREMAVSEADLVQRLVPAVVSIYTRGSEEGAETLANGTNDKDAGPLKSYYGSGFIIEPDGLIVTNRHVVQGARQLIVGLSDGSRMLGTVVAAAGKVDLALIRVSTDHKLPVMVLGDSDKMRVGDPVLAIGNPLHLGTSVSAGIVSGLNRNINESAFDSFIQTDAAINHGNSGGPLVNMQGEVIGINSAIFSESDNSGSIGLGFALTSNDMKFLVTRLRQYGRVKAGWVGAYFQDLSSTLAGIFGNPALTGVVVTSITPGSPAETAGLTEGDVVQTIGGKVPSDARGALRAFGSTPVGDDVPLSVWRDGKNITLTVQIAEVPGALAPVNPAPLLNQFVTNGLELSAIDDEARHTYNFAPDQSGVLVTGVPNNLFTGERSLMPGDLILRVQDTHVTTPDGAHRLIDAAKARGQIAVALLVKSRGVQTWMPLGLNDPRERH